MAATAWPFIELDDAGCLTIHAKGSKVLHLVREYLTFDWDAEQLRRQHPHLSLAEIHAALGYYDSIATNATRLWNAMKSGLSN